MLGLQPISNYVLEGRSYTATEEPEYNKALRLKTFKDSTIYGNFEGWLIG